jgi:radical SAM enzyme (TIGR01210 family)
MFPEPLHRAALDPWSAYGASWEEEPDAAGVPVPTAVVLLTNRQCPFACVMCDLWTHTLEEPVPPGAIPRQIHDALASLPPARQVKLYNAGSFFDPAAIPPDDDEVIARLLAGYERVIVEAHPAFLAGPYGERCLQLRDRIDGRLEVAIGLETANEAALARLNKHMTIESFARAADFLARHRIDLRVFVLLKPPLLSDDEGVEWANRSIDVAISCGAAVCSVIPTRGGHAPLHQHDSQFSEPTLPSLERVLDRALSGRAVGERSEGAAVGSPDPTCRVFADLWDAGRFADCDCSAARIERLRAMNRTQRVAPAVSCHCGR